MSANKILSLTPFQLSYYRHNVLQLNLDGNVQWFSNPWNVECIFEWFDINKLEVNMDSHKSGPSNHKIISFSNDILTLVEEYYQIGSCQSCIGCETSSLHVYKCATGCVAYIIIMPSLAQAVRILTACVVCSPLVHSCSIVCAALHSLCGL